MAARKLPTGIDLLSSGMFRWRIKIRGVAHSGVSDTLAGAVAARDQAKRDALDAALVAGTVNLSPRTAAVRDLVDLWRAEVRHAPTTAAERDRAIGKLPREFLERRASTVTPPVVAALWRSLSKSIDPHTVKRAQKALSAAWKHAIVHGLATSNPVRAASFTVDKSARIDPPAPDVVRRIITEAAVTPATKWSAAVERPELSVFLRIMATIGTRPSELCALRWDDVDPKTRSLHIGRTTDRARRLGDGKNGPDGWRVVKLDPDTFAALKSIQRVVGVPWVFHINHLPWRPDDVSRSFRKVRDRLGIRGVRLYDLRHFAATQAIAAGVPIPEVAYMLGDNPATVMKTYAHATGAVDAPAAVARTLSTL